MRGKDHEESTDDSVRRCRPERRPLSFAQANDYLAQRQNLDNPAHIQAIARQAIAQGEQARANGQTQGQGRDYLAERQDLDQAPPSSTPTATFRPSRPW